MTKRFGLLVLLAALGAFSSACTGTAGEICDLQCECTGCNDEEYDECVVNVEASEDRAAAYDCGEEADILEECILADNDCDEVGGEEFFTYDCDDEADDLNDCLADGTDLDFDLGG